MVERSSHTYTGSWEKTSAIYDLKCLHFLIKTLILDYQYHSLKVEKLLLAKYIRVHGSKILEYVYCDITQSSVYFWVNPCLYVCPSMHEISLQFMNII